MIMYIIIITIVSNLFMNIFASSYSASCDNTNILCLLGNFGYAVIIGFGLMIFLFIIVSLILNIIDYFLDSCKLDSNYRKFLSISSDKNFLLMLKNIGDLFEDVSVRVCNCKRS